MSAVPGHGTTGNGGATTPPGTHEAVRLMKTPLSGVVSMTVSPKSIIFGSLSGTLHVHQLSLGPHGKPYFSLQGRELVVNDGGIPIDVLHVSPAGTYAVCLSGGKDVTFVRNVGGPQAMRFDAPRDGAPFVVCSTSLDQQYTSRACSHCWMDDSTFAAGCVDGSVVMVAVDPTCDQIAFVATVIREDAPIVHLQYDVHRMTMCVSSLCRSGVINACKRDMVLADATLTQIGVKARSQGLYGACLSTQTDRVYAARPSRRIFEADPATGTVFKTYKLPECKHELSILKLVDLPPKCPDGAPNDEVLIVTESPKFIGLISLGASSSWKIALQQSERAILCGVLFLNFYLFLCSDDQVLTLEVAPALPAQQHHGQTETPVATPRDPSEALSPDPSGAAASFETAARPQQQPLSKEKRPDDSPKASDTTAPDFVNAKGEVAVRLIRRPKGSGNSGNLTTLTTAEGDGDGDGDRAGTGGASPAAGCSPPPSASGGGSKRVKRVVKKRIVKTSGGVRTEIIEESVSGSAPGPSRSSQQGCDEGPESPVDVSSSSWSTGRGGAALSTADTALASAAAAPAQGVSRCEESSDTARVPVCEAADVAPPPELPSVESEAAGATVDSCNAAEEPSAPQPGEARQAADNEGNIDASDEACSPCEEQRSESPPAPVPSELFEPKAPPTPLELFAKDTEELAATHAAFSLDKAAQPRLLADMLRWSKTLEERLNDRNVVDSVVAAATREHFKDVNVRKSLLELLVSALEWIAFVPLPDAEPDVVRIGAQLYRQVERLHAGVDSDNNRAATFDKICTGISRVDKLHSITKLAAAQCIISCNEHAFPLLDTLEVDQWEMREEQFAPIEQRILEMSPDVVEDLQFREFSLSYIIHYFPYLFAMLPSKATQVALATFPSISIRHLQWSLSGHVQTQAVQLLKSCGIDIARMESDDLADSLCDITLRIIHEHTEHVMQKQSFARTVAVLLERRHQLLLAEGLDATPATSSPVSRGPHSERGKPSVLVVRKLRRLDEALLSLLKTSKLKLNIAFPELRGLFDKYVFPQGIVEIRAIEESIEDAVKSERVDRLLPLFQMTDVITEANWISLFVNCHNGGQLERGVYLCLTVVQQPRRVRYLLRKAFPYVDSPNIDDEQLKSVVDKLGALIN